MNSNFGRYGAGTQMARGIPGNTLTHAPTSASRGGSTPSRQASPKDQASNNWWNTNTIAVYHGGPSYRMLRGRDGRSKKVLAESSAAFFLSDGYAFRKASLILMNSGAAGKPGSTLWKGAFHEITGPKRSAFNVQKAAPNRGGFTRNTSHNVANTDNAGQPYVPPTDVPTQPPATGYPPVLDQGYPIQPLPSAFNTPSNGPTDSGASSGQVVSDDSQAVEEGEPFYKNPMVLLGAAVLAGGAFLFLKSKKGKKEKKHKKEHKA